MSILRNGNVPCRFFFAISMSILRYSNVTCRIEGIDHVLSLVFFPMSIGFMLYVDFKKWPCCPVESKGQGPADYWCMLGAMLTVS